MKEKIVNILYLIGGGLVQCGAITQIIKMHRTHSVSDFAFLWLLALTIGEILHLPRSLNSQYWAWKVICITATTTIMVLFFSYLTYR